MNKQHISLLVFLDLSSVFDMIDHMVLLRRLEDKFVFCRTALEFVPVRQIPAGCNRRCNFWQVRHRLWCTAAFLHRSIIVSIYAGQLLDIVTQHLPTVHCYADDTELYLAFRPLKMRLLLQWRLVYKISDDKSEFILIGTQAQLKKVDIDNLTVGNSCISPSTDVIRNLGAWFHVSFTMSTHIKKTCKTGFFYLHNISRIRKLLTQEITENLIHAFVTSCLDYCNSLL